MIEQNKLELFKKHPLIENFLEGTAEFEISSKILNFKDIKRIYKEYPKFELSLYVHSKEIQIFTITIIKIDRNPENYQKFKKIKIYVNESNGKIIKILQN